VRRVLGTPERDLNGEVWRDPVPEGRAAAWERAWEKTAGLVGEIARVVSASEARLAVVVFANGEEVADAADPRQSPPGFDFKRPSRRMAALCAARGVPCLELAPRFAQRERAVREEMFLEGDGHWSAVGHGAAAEEVAKFLTAETTLWRDLVAQAGRER
jgi:hypothetical protein